MRLLPRPARSLPPVARIVSAATALSTAALSTVALTGGASAAPAPAGLSHRTTHVCASSTAGHAHCDAVRRDVVGASGRPMAAAAPSGYGPSDIRSAYGLASATGGGRTVAIVDAYDDPSAEADLAVYRSQYGLPACTTANGCFSKVGQTGGRVPKSDAGWAQEISLDLDMVSATCPDCHVLLVEASSTSFTDLAAAVDYAAGRGVAAISNSYGGSDTSSSSSGKAYDHPGIAITASTGDGGYGVESPASYPTVVAVGGTSLKRSGTSWSESAWSGAGSGCSTVNAKPSWQTSATSCSHRANADVSAVADPNTGVAVYDSYAYQGTRGWMVFGGTSASAPIIAGVYTMGTARTKTSYPAAYTWAHTAGLHDVTSGSNGSCSTAVWCRSGSGWDGPTGLGTPNGTSAF